MSRHGPFGPAVPADGVRLSEVCGYLFFQEENGTLRTYLAFNRKHSQGECTTSSHEYKPCGQIHLIYTYWNFKKIRNW